MIRWCSLLSNAPAFESINSLLCVITMPAQQIWQLWEDGTWRKSDPVRQRQTFARDHRKHCAADSKTWNLVTPTLPQSNLSSCRDSHEPRFKRRYDLLDGKKLNINCSFEECLSQMTWSCITFNNMLPYRPIDFIERIIATCSALRSYHS